MMPLLHNYVIVDFDAFLGNNGAYAMALYQMCKTMLESKPGEDPECYAAKLLEIIILQGKAKKNIDTLIPHFLEVVLMRLSREIKTSELRTMCLQVAIAAFYYDSTIFFETLSKMQLPNGISGPPVVKHFIEQWLHDTDCFIGLHDRKLSIIAFCSLLSQPQAESVPGLVENSTRFFPSLLMLFEGLKRAYEQLAEAEQAEQEETEDEDQEDEEDEDKEVLVSDEDDVATSNPATVYLESLQDKVQQSFPGTAVK